MDGVRPYWKLQVLGNMGGIPQMLESFLKYENHVDVDSASVSPAGFKRIFWGSLKSKRVAMQPKVHLGICRFARSGQAVKADSVVTMDLETSSAGQARSLRRFPLPPSHPGKIKLNVATTRGACQISFWG